jgi:MFS transporter, AAHS family, 4-hydroxybenzoate transporter
MSHPANIPTGSTSGLENNWTTKALLIVGLCFAINMVDGMDVVIMSYIAPSLARDWNVAPEALGVIFSAGLLGMAIGGLFIAPLADKFGRRRIILTALALMSTGMVACGFVTGIKMLVAARIVVGAGIGTVLAAMAALVSEAAPAGRQSLAVGVVQAGYPLAAVFTGLATAHLLPVYGWQPLLLFAGVSTILMLPITWFIMPDSARQDVHAPAPPPLFKTLLGPDLLRRTLLLWTAVFMGLMVLYFIVSWIPKLSIEAGLSETNAIYAGALYNFGAFTGTMMMSLLSMRVALSRLIPVLLVSAGVAMMVFGSLAMSVPLTLFVAFIIGVTLQGGYNGIWPLSASIYPPERRATGIGWAVGIGRGGAVIGPLIGGYMMAAQAPLPLLFGVYCVPLLLCGLAVYLIGSLAAHRSA